MAEEAHSKTYCDVNKDLIAKYLDPKANDLGSKAKAKDLSAKAKDLNLALRTKVCLSLVNNSCNLVSLLLFSLHLLLL